MQSIRYKINHETRRSAREYGPFALFETEQQAREFAAALSGRYSILLCIYEPSSEKGLWKKNPPSFCKNRFGSGYHAESNGITERYIEYCPEGTILADSVYPVEIIAEGV